MKLQPAYELAKRYGIKVVIFGGPGSGKTPIIGTAPNPVVLVTEPGMLSMRHSSMPAFEAYTADKINEFLSWMSSSTEVNKYDTVGVDSLSNIAEIILLDEQKKCKDGRMAYGNMADKVMEICNKLYYYPNKHIVMTCKQMFVDNGRQTVMTDGGILHEPILQKRPYFPGRELNTKLPHLFDSILHLGQATIAGYAKPQSALRTKEITEIFARDRMGNLDEIEPSNLTSLFSKAMV